MTPNKKILVITPRFPYPESGACEQDRAEGFRQLKRLGYDVRLVGKYFDWQDPEAIATFWKKEGIDVTLVPYQKKKKLSFILDGAAAEYAEPEIQRVVEQVIKEWQPAIAWFDYTYLWPLYRICKYRNIPIVVRSINFEALHYLDEDGHSFFHWLRAMPKFLTEFITARGADMLFAITPTEEKQYRRIRAKWVTTLPLRSLYKKLGTHTPKEAERLHVFFAGSTYNVSHNRRALEFVIKDVAPKAKAIYGDVFTFHIFGAKLPEDLLGYVKNNVVYEGFVEDLDARMQKMDIAIAPSLFGRGMQQKIFEPLARGFPTILHARGIAGYDFVAGVDYVPAETAEEYVRSLGELRSIDRRRALSDNCTKKSWNLFSQYALDTAVASALNFL